MTDLSPLERVPAAVLREEAAQAGPAPAPTPVRSVGVEEELLLVDPSSGRPVPVAGSLVRRGHGRVPVGTAAGRFGGLDSELQQEQLETATPPRVTLGDLALDLRRLRRTADDAARSAGARIAALATSPFPVSPRLTQTRRYLAMRRQFGVTCAEQLTCGCHVHVAVDSDEEGVAVLDRVRPWLPVITALAANSPYWNGADTGYASYRTQAWSRWPSSGPTDVFGSAGAYHDVVHRMVSTGSLLDEGMIYFDARLSWRYPTVELRVADVCLDVDDAVLVAGLARALVDTAAAEWHAGVPPLDVPTSVLRLAAWRASRSSLADRLVHPLDQRPRSARVVVQALLDHVRPALEVNGDLPYVRALLDQVLGRGCGAVRQRAVLAKTGRLGDVVADAVDRTTA
ncbi:MAG TPA: glutamate--cysteine ligase [Actinomycetales bacterium]|nr:glutamate--cysteine ligase [Actinomycetales bacterium]